MLALLSNVTINVDEKDRWIWHLNGKHDFDISCLRKAIDRQLLSSNGNVPTIWNKLVQKKVNIFIWRLRRDCLPTSINLFPRGIDVTSVNCQVCRHGVEFIDHIFGSCKLVADTRSLLSSWLCHVIPNSTPDSVLQWCDNLAMSVTHRIRTQAIIFIWWWRIWKARNTLIHDDVRESSYAIFHSIINYAFL